MVKPLNPNFLVSSPVFDPVIATGGHSIVEGIDKSNRSAAIVSK